MAHGSWLVARGSRLIASSPHRLPASHPSGAAGRRAAGSPLLRARLAWFVENSPHPFLSFLFIYLFVTIFPSSGPGGADCRAGSPVRAARRGEPSTGPASQRPPSRRLLSASPRRAAPRRTHPHARPAPRPFAPRQHGHQGVHRLVLRIHGGEQRGGKVVTGWGGPSGRIRGASPRLCPRLSCDTAGSSGLREEAELSVGTARLGGEGSGAEGWPCLGLSGLGLGLGKGWGLARLGLGSGKAWGVDSVGLS